MASPTNESATTDKTNPKTDFGIWLPEDQANVVKKRNRTPDAFAVCWLGFCIVAQIIGCLAFIIAVCYYVYALFV